jgi:hypothetical protein
VTWALLACTGSARAGPSCSTAYVLGQLLRQARHLLVVPEPLQLPARHLSIHKQNALLHGCVAARQLLGLGHHLLQRADHHALGHSPQPPPLAPR